MISKEMRDKLIKQLHEELMDDDMYEVMSRDFDNPCKQVLKGIAHDERSHARHLYDIMKRNDVESPVDLEKKYNEHKWY